MFAFRNTKLSTFSARRQLCLSEQNCLIILWFGDFSFECSYSFEIIQMLAWQMIVHCRCHTVLCCHATMWYCWYAYLTCSFALIRLTHRKVLPNLTSFSISLISQSVSTAYTLQWVCLLYVTRYRCISDISRVGGMQCCFMLLGRQPDLADCRSSCRHGSWHTHPHPFPSFSLPAAASAGQLVPVSCPVHGVQEGRVSATTGMQH